MPGADPKFLVHPLPFPPPSAMTKPRTITSSLPCVDLGRSGAWARTDPGDEGLSGQAVTCGVRTRPGGVSLVILGKKGLQQERLQRTPEWARG